MEGIPDSFNNKPLVHAWTYHGADDNAIGVVGRYESDGYKECVPFFNHNGKGWAAGGAGLPRPLYGLDVLARESPGRVVLVVEGEKSAAALHSMGFVAVTSPGGSKAAEKADWTPLSGRVRVYLLPDNDEAGEGYVRTVFVTLRELESPPEVELVHLPDLPSGGDVVDWLQARLEWDGYSPVPSPEAAAEDLKTAIRDHAAPVPSEWLDGEDTPPRERSMTVPEPGEIVSASELCRMNFPPPVLTVKGLIPTGAMILAGKPKMGKSWMVLAIGVAVASGGKALGKLDVTPGSVLYLALEDPWRRLKLRLEKIVGANVPEALNLVTQWPRLDEGGAEHLRNYLEKHNDTRLIIVDTLQRIRRVSNGQHFYEQDYEAIATFNELAIEFDVTILIIHHLRKGEADDPLEAISGTYGLTGSADGAMILKRDRGNADAYLHAIHRDLEEDQELALRWEQDKALWVVLGDAAEYKLSQLRSAILRTLDLSRTAREVSDLIEQSYDNVRKVMERMEKDGLIRRVGGNQKTGIEFERSDTA